MSDLNPRHAVFVTAAYALQPEGGGVQHCTREYLQVARAAGFTLHPVSFATDRRPLARLRRKFRPRPYSDLVAPGFEAEVLRHVQASGARWIFFNQTDAGQIAPRLAALRTSGVRFALLSHGIDSTDSLHTAHTRANFGLGPPVSDGDALLIGRQIFAEAAMHRHFDAIFCLSESDRLFEQWLGGKNVQVLPRLVESAPLDWIPTAGRLGTVGTLGHAPNLDGLVQFCRAFVATPVSVRLRLVGSPPAIGEKLAREFPFIDYLGSLTDIELQAEARTWCAFLNPIFCVPRGCSTKLAVPLGWHLPVVTTRPGARGYFWDEALVPFSDTPAEFARLAMQLSDPVAAAHLRPAITEIAQRSPQLEEVAARFAAALLP